MVSRSKKLKEQDEERREQADGEQRQHEHEDGQLAPLQPAPAHTISGAQCECTVPEGCCMGCMLYVAVLLYAHTALYGAVWLYGAGGKA